MNTGFRTKIGSIEEYLTPVRVFSEISGASCMACLALERTLESVARELGSSGDSDTAMGAAPMASTPRRLGTFASSQ